MWHCMKMVNIESLLPASSLPVPTPAPRPPPAPTVLSFSQGCERGYDVIEMARACVYVCARACMLTCVCILLCVCISDALVEGASVEGASVEGAVFKPR